MSEVEVSLTLPKLRICKSLHYFSLRIDIWRIFSNKIFSVQGFWPHGLYQCTRWKRLANYQDFITSYCNSYDSWNRLGNYWNSYTWYYFTIFQDWYRQSCIETRPGYRGIYFTSIILHHKIWNVWPSIGHPQYRVMSKSRANKRRPWCSVP